MRRTMLVLVALLAGCGGDDPAPREERARAAPCQGASFRRHRAAGRPGARRGRGGLGRARARPGAPRGAAAGADRDRARQAGHDPDPRQPGGEAALRRRDDAAGPLLPAARDRPAADPAGRARPHRALARRPVRALLPRRGAQRRRGDAVGRRDQRLGDGGQQRPDPLHLPSMSVRAWVAFAAVSTLWGMPYLFIKVAVDDGVPPALLAWVRIVLGAAVLLGLAWRAGSLGSLRGRWRWIAVFAVVEITFPFPLIAAGEQHVSSSLAAIIVAAAPLFVALLAIRFDAEERASGGRLVGL